MLGLSWSLNRAPSQLQQFPREVLTDRQQSQDKIDKEYAGAKNTGGITWQGSQFTGPGNKLVDAQGKSNFTELPKTDLDWVTMEHDVDYYNATNPTKNEVWEMDKKAMKAAWDIKDPYYGAAATIVGLVAKNIAERTDEAITGDPYAIYPGSKSSSHIIPWFKKRTNIKKKELRGGGNRIDSSASEQDTEQSSTFSSHGIIEPADDTDSLRTPSVDWSVDSVFGDDNDNNFNHILRADDVVAGTSAAGGITDKELWPHLPVNNTHMASHVSSTKRGPEDQVGSSGESKKQKTNGMELPGTGESGGSDPDTGNPSPENSVIPRPIQSMGGYKLVFRKNHSLLSYGLAWKISKLDGTSKSYLTTTSLMSLPVEQPYFYLSPAEFDWLPRGAICKHVKVTAVMRNPRTAFETNSTSTTLATLNQNKFIAIGEGLNLKTRGIDRAMKFGLSTAAMVNQGTEEYTKPHHEKFIIAAYGSLTKAPTFQEGFKNLPCSSLMLPMMLNRYFCTVATNDVVNKDIGWPNLSNYIRKGDASFLTGKTVATYSYSPKCGFLSQPFQMRINGYYGDETSSFANNSISTINKNGNLLSSVVQTDLASGNMKQSDNNIIDYESGEWDNLAKKNGSHYMTPIEKSQYIMRGPNDAGRCHVQPSLHIGVFPVPRMTTNELKTVPENYTDIEVQWDVHCEMTVEFGYGTLDLTHYDKPYLVNVENAAYGAVISSDKDTYFQDQYSSVNGEYVCRVKKSSG